MGLYSALARPALFRLSPERAQRIGDGLLRVSPLWRALRPALTVRDARLETNLVGVRFPNPVGVAAGLDKDCRFLPSLLDIGFGFATGGTVTRDARPGNARPRLLREPGKRALINALGFPGRGLDAAEARLRRLPDHRRTRLMVSVSGTGVDDIAECHRRLQPLVAAVEVNVSSPNTAGLREFHDAANLRRLIAALVAQRDRPLFVKLPPWSSDEERDESLSMARAALESGADGLVVANTRPVEDARLGVGRGGLSGAPLLEDTLRMVAETRAEIPDGVAVIACGGIGTADAVWRALEAGASAVQLYTALIYEGPGIARRINRGLLRRMAREGLERLPGPRDCPGGEPGAEREN